MSRDYRDYLNKITENNQDASTREDNSKDYFQKTSNVRNIIFQWENGRQFFVNYNYMISCEIDPENTILTLSFTNCSVILKGTKLDRLFEFLSTQQIRVIKETTRYAQISEDEFLVESIERIEA